MFDILMYHFILLSCHCLGDFPLQGEFLSEWKDKNFYCLLVHCMIYSFVMYLGCAYVMVHSGKMKTIDSESSCTIFLTFLISHVIIDFCKCTARNLLAEEEKDGPKDIGMFHIDQMLHIAVIVSFLYYILIKG